LKTSARLLPRQVLDSVGAAGGVESPPAASVAAFAYG